MTHKHTNKHTHTHILGFYCGIDRRTGPVHFFWGGGTHIFSPFCPNPRQRWKPRWGGGLVRGTRAPFFFLPCPKSLLNFSIGLGVYEILQAMPATIIDDPKKKKKKKKIAQIFPQFSPNCAQNLPEVCPNLPEFCPKFAQILTSAKFLWGGGGAQCPRLLLRLWL